MIHLSGAITDPSGAPVPGAMIELRALNSTSEVLIGAVLTFKCDEQGAYAFDLGIGKYDAYAQNDYQGDMDYLGTAAVDEHTEDGDLHHILVDGGISLSPPMLDAALDAMQRAEAAAAQSASDRQQTGADALTTAQNRAVATDKAAESAQSAVLSVEARDSIVQDAAEVRAKAEQVSADSLAVDAGRQSVQQNADIVATNTATAIHQAGLAETAALAAQQDRVSVSDMLSDVTSKAGQAVAAADTASQKAVLAAQSEASAKADADRAENAAGSIIGAILDGGTCDLSTGVYPTPISVNGSPYSTVWYVQVGGTVSGTTFDVGDLLRYTTSNGGQYFKVDAKDEVYSVNGEKGAVVLTPEKIGAEQAGVAETQLQQHEAKDGAHAIAGVSGLQAALDAKASAAVVRAATIIAGSGAQSVSAEQIGSSLLFTEATAVAMPTLASLGGVTGHYRIMAGSNPITLTRIDGTSFIVRGATVASVTIPAGSDCYVAYSATGVYVYGLATYETIVKSYCLVNALGTGAPNELVSAALPANLAINSRYVLTNPFGINTPVIGWAEVFYKNKWSQAGFIFSSGASNSYGVSFNYVQGEGIIILTGSGALAINSSQSGSGHGAGYGEEIKSAPCRVLIQKLGA